MLEATLKEVDKWLDTFQAAQSEAGQLTHNSPSLLLRELISSVNDGREAHSMPIFRCLTHIHSFVGLFQNMTNNVQPEVRTICVSVWGGVGLPVMTKLATLYRTLIWESTILIELIDGQAPADGILGHGDFELLTVKDEFLTPLPPKTGSSSKSKGELAASNVVGSTQSSASPTTDHLESEVQLMEIGSPTEHSASGPVNQSQTSEKRVAAKQRMIKAIPHEVAMQLGAKLSHLFALFVKMSVGGPPRGRQGGFSRNNSPQMPSKYSRAIASALAVHLADTLKWESPLPAPSPRFRFSFLTCAVQLRV